MNKELKSVKLSMLVPYENNPRRNDDAVEAVAESINQCGYVAPIIVDEDYTILAGHTRFKALLELGREDADILMVFGLTEEQKKKYRLLDNKTNEIAGWDFNLLDIELEEIDFNGYDFGFTLPAGDEEDESESEPSFNYHEQYGVIVMCASEVEQENVYNSLTAEGYECKVVSV